jgi:sigma-54 specific flagellar transcriptional regulator A
MRRAFYFIQHKLIGQCDSMKQLRMNLWNNIFTCDILHYEKNLTAKMEDFSTLLLGPTGCGKGTAAAAIGRSGYIPFDDKKMRFTESFTRTFVPVNLSQYAETLLESELFGHSKGAFTGAISPHDGLLAMCGPCGSVFLDEIGEVGEQVQIKLLKVLEEREFSPVGSHEKLSFRGRVIGATNQGIGKLIEQGKFRDDFYYRLCSDCIEVPSLKQRISESPDELAELTREVTRRITGQESEGIVESTLEVIGRQLGMEYDWPGNVRELAQCIRRVIIKRDYQPDICNGRLDAKAEIAEQIYDGEVTAQRLLATYCNLLYEKHGNYEKVAQITGLDRRTAKKHIQSYEQG